MSKSWAIFVVGLLLLASVVHVPCVRAADPEPATQPATDEERMKSWWDDLEKPEPESSRALLQFAAKPQQTVAFLKEHLKPLTISEDDVKKLLKDLGSDDENVWKPAFETFEYLDPRLAIRLPELMAEVTDMTTRPRLVAVLCDVSADAYAGQSIELSPPGNSPGSGYNFRSMNSSWWAEAEVERLNARHGNSKKKWTRATRAIVLLQFINTPEAIAILKDMATGHEDAAPTKAAKEALSGLATNDAPAK